MKTARHYEFREWKACFKELRKILESGEKDLQLVVSNNIFTTGYWIESIKEITTPEDRSLTIEEAFNLEKHLIYNE